MENRTKKRGIYLEDLRQEKEQQLYLKFRQINRTLKKTIVERVRHTGVYDSQHRLLMHLFDRPNCSQTELAEQLEISPAAVAVSIKKLEKGGYIRRAADKRDSRINQVEITEKGRQVFETSIQIFRKIDSLMFEGFSDMEMEQMGGFLDRMHQNLTAADRSEE